MHSNTLCRPQKTGMLGGMIDSYYAYAILLVILLSLEWVLTLVALPGNWLMVLTLWGFHYLFPMRGTIGVSGAVVLVAVGLAVLGEIVEFVSGAAGMAKGGTRRGAVLAMVGSLIGGIFGASVGSAVPVLGTIVVGLLGGAIGALGGAYVGEKWAGRSDSFSREIGKAAFWGRLFGSGAKMLLGGVILILATIAAFF